MGNERRFQATNGLWLPPKPLATKCLAFLTECQPDASSTLKLQASSTIRANLRKSLYILHDFSFFALNFHAPNVTGLTHLLLSSVVPNATFQVNDSVLCTGEDFSLSMAHNVTVFAVEGPAITEQTVAKQEEMVGCKSTERKAINCSDSGVLAAIIGFKRHHFADLNFYSYQTRVRGM